MAAKSTPVGTPAEMARLAEARDRDVPEQAVELGRAAAFVETDQPAKEPAAGAPAARKS